MVLVAHVRGHRQWIPREHGYSTVGGTNARCNAGSSDKPSDNDLRQQADRVRRTPDAGIRSGLRQADPVATPSDETGMHGKEKVYGSIP